MAGESGVFAALILLIDVVVDGQIFPRFLLFSISYCLLGQSTEIFIDTFRFIYVYRIWRRKQKKCHDNFCHIRQQSKNYGGILSLQVPPNQQIYSFRQTKIKNSFNILMWLMVGKKV